jgi:predicted ABC-type ATPase
MGGYNSTIFAYGQTGAGKTYTMQGPMAAALEECEEVSCAHLQHGSKQQQQQTQAQCGRAAAHVFASSIGIVQQHMVLNAVGMLLHVRECRHL